MKGSSQDKRPLYNGKPLSIATSGQHSETNSLPNKNLQLHSFTQESTGHVEANIGLANRKKLSVSIKYNDNNNSTQQSHLHDSDHFTHGHSVEGHKGSDACLLAAQLARPLHIGGPEWLLMSLKKGARRWSREWLLRSLNRGASQGKMSPCRGYRCICLAGLARPCKANEKSHLDM